MRPDAVDVRRGDRVFRIVACGDIGVVQYFEQAFALFCVGRKKCKDFRRMHFTGFYQFFEVVYPRFFKGVDQSDRVEERFTCLMEIENGKFMIFVGVR